MSSSPPMDYELTTKAALSAAPCELSLSAVSAVATGFMAKYPLETPLKKNKTPLNKGTVWMELLLSHHQAHNHLTLQMTQNQILM